jgi:MFS family permease
MAMEAAMGVADGASGARRRRTILLASLGGALEYYDFILFGVFAKPIAQTFFPGSGEFSALIKAFLVFAVGYFARPLGGAILGRLGDRYGRRGVFLISLLVVSCATLGMGLLPGYRTLGAAAGGVGMLALRVTQGLFLGGEVPGATVYAVETAPHRPGLACGVLYAFINTGVLGAAMVNLGLSSVMPAPAVADWGWRLGFVLGGLMGFAAVLARRGLDESRGFEDLGEKVSRRPFLEALGADPLGILIAIGLMTATGAFNGLLFAHLPAFFAGALHYPPQQVALAQNLALICGSISLFVFAVIGDRIPRRLILRIGALAFVVLAWPFYRAMAAHEFNLLVALALAGAVSGLCNGTFAALASDLFPTRLRFTSLAIALNIAFSLTLGLSPLMATSLTASTGDLAAPAYVLMVCAMLTFLASFLTRSREGHIGRAE